MTQIEHDTIWLTQEAHTKLQQELDELRGPVRQEIIERISAARDEGDLKENGGYHAAKDEQGKVEDRIRTLEDTLRRAVVGEAKNDGTVSPGMKVSYSFVGDDDVEVAPARCEGERGRQHPGRLPAEPRSARRSSAPRRATWSATRRPTARPSRSRSSTRSPTPADRRSTTFTR